MRISIPALGTRGDVAPFVLLGAGLLAAGHEVRVATLEEFRGMVRAAGLGFSALPGESREIFGAAVGGRPPAAGTADTGACSGQMSPWRPLSHVRAVHRALAALVGQVRPDELAEALAGTELVVFGPTTTFGHLVAERLGARSLMVSMTPALATGAFAHPVLTPGVSLGRWGNRASWLAGERAQRQSFKEPLRPAERRAWGLPAFALAGARGRGLWPGFPLVHAYSAAVLPRPHDWPSHVTVDGWLLPERSRERLPEEVERFLAHGEPPVYVGFGSMPLADPERIARVLVGALARVGARAIVCGGALAQAPALAAADDVLVAQELPHERLFDRVAGVVHHGGSGTVGAGLRAGRPTLVVPFIFDQFFWGRRVHAIGAGPAPIPIAALSQSRLARALRKLGSERVRMAAAALGERVAAEDGVRAAAARIEAAHNQDRQDRP